MVFNSNPVLRYAALFQIRHTSLFFNAFWFTPRILCFQFWGEIWYQKSLKNLKELVVFFFRNDFNHESNEKKLFYKLNKHLLLNEYCRFFLVGVFSWNKLSNLCFQQWLASFETVQDSTYFSWIANTGAPFPQIINMGWSSRRPGK